MSSKIFFNLSSSNMEDVDDDIDLTSIAQNDPYPITDNVMINMSHIQHIIE